MTKDDEKHCNFCGNLIREEDVFCSNCGANLDEKSIDTSGNDITTTESLIEPLGQPLHEEVQEESNVRILSERPLTSEAIEIQRFTHEPTSSSYVLATSNRIPSNKGNNVPAIVSIVCTVIAAILFAIPCPCVGMFGGIPFSLLAFIFAIVGLTNPNRRVMSITAFIISLLAPGIWYLQFRFLWF